MTDDVTAPDGPAQLRAFREAKGLSLKAFADLVGCDKTLIGAIERRDKKPGLKTALSIQRVAGIDPAAFVDSDEPGGAAA